MDGTYGKEANAPKCRQCVGVPIYLLVVMAVSSWQAASYRHAYEDGRGSEVQSYIYGI
jgi:hypothetical protein